MKRFITMIVAACAFFAVSAQQFPMVTLSHDGELTFFTSVSAFEEAVEAAQHGDTLFLSEGNFATRNSTVVIDKYLNIQGSGYLTYLLANVYFSVGATATESIKIDGIRLKDISFELPYVKYAEVSRCKFDNVYNAGMAGENVLIDSCTIGVLDCYGAVDNKVTVKNSKIYETSIEDWYISAITVINCNIANVAYLPGVTISSILGDGVNSQYEIDGNPILINTLYNPNYMRDEVSPVNCYKNANISFDDNLNCTTNLTGYIGEDGLVVGIDGGAVPFSENPSVPSVNSSLSSVEYDSSTNKLKVNITVKAD